MKTRAMHIVVVLLIMVSWCVFVCLCCLCVCVVCVFVKCVFVKCVFVECACFSVAYCVAFKITQLIYAADFYTIYRRELKKKKGQVPKEKKKKKKERKREKKFEKDSKLCFPFYTMQYQKTREPRNHS